MPTYGKVMDALNGKAGSKELGCKGLVVGFVRGSDTLDNFQFFPASQKTSPLSLFRRYSIHCRVKSRWGRSASGPKRNERDPTQASMPQSRPIQCKVPPSTVTCHAPSSIAVIQSGNSHSLSRYAAVPPIKHQVYYRLNAHRPLVSW